MLRRTTVRLTLGYLAIVMTISVIFSLILYNVSASEISSGLRRQLPYFRTYEQSMSDGLDFRGLETIEESHALSTLRLRLVLVNVVVLIGSGGLCYWLARRTLEPIERSLEAQTRFTADASHELRTPLTAMKAEIEVALRVKKLSAEDLRELLASNLEEIGKLELLVQGLLKLARREAPPKPQDLEAVSLAKVAEQALARLSSLAGERKVTFSNQVEPLLVAGEVNQLVEVVTILIDNAIKYGPRGGTVTLSSSSTKSTGTIEVRDEGDGIAPADLPHIFDRFYRADRARSRDGAGGYGLGLSIAREVASRYRGTVTATNHPAGGAIFRLTLPRSA